MQNARRINTLNPTQRISVNGKDEQKALKK